MSSTLVTQSRIASFMASFSVPRPLVTGMTSAPSSFMRKTFGDCRCDVGRAHVDDALQAEAGADGGGRHAVLAGAGLGDDPLLAHPHGQQDLAHAVVDLVRAGVVQLVALEPDIGRLVVLRQPLGEIQRAGPTDIVGQVVVQLGLERRIGLAGLIGLVQLQHERHQGLGDEPPAIGAEPALDVGHGVLVGDDGVHGQRSRKRRRRKCGPVTRPAETPRSGRCP